jgi:ubiquinol-cytochrome c reductase cytochrome b subunit
MLMWHIVLLPLVVGILVGGHILLVRLRGVVPPFAPPDQLAIEVKQGVPADTAVSEVQS